MDRNLLVGRQNTILEAMFKINKNTKGVVFVEDENKRLCGVFTDGDLRRAILHGAELSDSLEGFLHKDFAFVHEKVSLADAFSQLNSRIRILPVVNDDMRVVDCYEYTAAIRIPVAEPFLRENEFKYATEAILSTWISSKGKYIPAFEESFSSYCGTKYGVATSNGTTALHLALVALGIGQGDEVIVPNLTFAATINVVLHAGATPVLVDVEEDSWCVSPQAIKAAITERTKAIIPVHLYGQPCDMESIMEIARSHRLYVIEDCAEAHGAEFKGQKVGSFGDVGCFSFFGNKVITTGEGGMCLTDNPDLAERMRLYRDHGMSRERRYWHDVVGYNYRMTNIQAAIGVAQVERIDNLLAKRAKVEQNYKSALEGIPRLRLQREDLLGRKKITWLVSILTEPEMRDVIMKKLEDNRVDVRPFFYPLSSMDIYKPFVRKPMPVSERISACGINLPTTIDLPLSAVKRIGTILNEVLA